MDFEEKIVWHKVAKRPLTDEEREMYAENYQPEYILDCPLPEDAQEILIATKWGVSVDICGIDDGYYLEGQGDWDDVIAWAEMPNAGMPCDRYPNNDLKIPNNDLKIGDTIFETNDRGEICKLKISNIEMAIDKEKKYAGRCLNYEECTPNVTPCIRPHESCGVVFGQSAVGRTVFLSYEEAKKALEEKRI